MIRSHTGHNGFGSGSPTPARLLAGVLLAGALSGTLAGCGAAPELDPGAARDLQAHVLAVSEAAAAGDPTGSLKHLDELLARLDAAAASGEVSFKRHQSITSSIDAVRADLTAQQAAAEASRLAAEQAAAEKATAEKAAAEKAAAEKAAAEQAAAAAAAQAAQAAAPPAQTASGAGAPAPADGSSNRSNANRSGPADKGGNGNGNGNGKSKDKGKDQD